MALRDRTKEWHIKTDTEPARTFQCVWDMQHLGSSRLADVHRPERVVGDQTEGSVHKGPSWAQYTHCAAALSCAVPWLGSSSMASLHLNDEQCVPALLQFA